jgi:hypothetical protein
MADGVKIRPSGASDAVEIHADRVEYDGVDGLVQRVKLGVGAPGVLNDVDDDHPVPTHDAVIATLLGLLATSARQDQQTAALNQILSSVDGLESLGSQQLAAMAALAKGTVVPVYARPAHIASLLGTAGGSVSQLPVGVESNEDGSGGGNTFTTPGAIDNIAGQGYTFWGSYFGWRWRRDQNADPFSIIVDGHSVGPSPAKQMLDNAAAPFTDGEAYWLPFTNLDPSRPHTARVFLTPDVYGGVSRTFVSFGPLLDGRFYERKPRLRQFITPTLLTTTAATAFPRATGGSDRSMRGIERVFLWNSSATDNIDVLVKKSGSTAIPVRLRATGTVNADGKRLDGDVVNFGGLMAIDTSSPTITVQASTANAVYVTPMGGY